jgi:hypothetical protein
LSLKIRTQGITTYTSFSSQKSIKRLTIKAIEPNTANRIKEGMLRDCKLAGSLQFYSDLQRMFERNVVAV